MLCVSDIDILVDRNIEFYTAMVNVGKAVKMMIYKGVGHAFQILDNSPVSTGRTQEMISHLKSFINSSSRYQFSCTDFIIPIFTSDIWPVMQGIGCPLRPRRNRWWVVVAASVLDGGGDDLIRGFKSPPIPSLLNLWVLFAAHLCHCFRFRATLLHR
ncbi:hypothetical protein KSS87_013647 [Heliosperma pusillum]|nr:hypothetical protein KSS87_013647 [Heliosperma pusillum]